MLSYFRSGELFIEKNGALRTRIEREAEFFQVEDLAISVSELKDSEDPSRYTYRTVSSTRNLQQCLLEGWELVSKSSFDVDRCPTECRGLAELVQYRTMKWSCTQCGYNSVNPEGHLVKDKVTVYKLRIVKQ
jgi:hypothetical protein